MTSSSHPLVSPEGIVFLLLAGLVVGLGFFCMTRRNPVTAVMSLVGSFFGLAGLYATLNAHFLAILQVLVYAGAIMVLFIFVVMILNREETEAVALRGITTRLLGVAAAVYLFLVFVRVAVPVGPAVLPPPVSETFGTVSAIGYVLFREFLFPFEAISLLLLTAIVGGVVVSRSGRKEAAEVSAAEHRIAVAQMQWSPFPEGSGDDAHQEEHQEEHGGAHDDSSAAGGDHDAAGKHH